MERPHPRRPEPAGPLDEAILYLDSPSEPWSVHLEVQLEGALDETRLRWAVRTALHRHPRAAARLVATSRPGRRPEWHATPTPSLDPFDVIHCEREEDLAAAREELLSRPFSLEASPPLLVRLLRHPGGDNVVLNLHHAAGDGMAALVFLQSVARAYAGRPDAVTDLVPNPVVTRPSRRRLATVPAEVLRAARPSARIAPDGGRDAPGYALHFLGLDTSRTRALRETARDGVTVNDLLVAALHLTVAGWNAEHASPCRQLSVLMPVNLRPRRHWREGFGNRTFMVPVVTLPRHRVSPSATVDAVRRRTRRIKEHGTAAAVAGCVRHLQSLPAPARRGIVRLAARERVMPTTLLSNLGVLGHDLDFGPGVGPPTHVWFSPPAKMPLGLALGALTANDQLHVVLRVRRPLLGREALGRLAASYESALDALIGAHNRPARPSPARRRAA
ncbi:MAG TPA: condensation domain-containing protein [Acidimicrobiales bacterium]|nr:condensation domain-containing protein [Acidimicrobiales bacterium]